MPKRKFDEHQAGQNAAAEDHLSDALSHSKKLLLRALTKARDFERPKLQKRQKGPVFKGRKREHDTRLVAEAKALEEVDLSALTEFYLYKTIARTTSIATAVQFPDFLRPWATKASPFSDGPCANVTARLFKSPPVRAAMLDILKSIRRALGLDPLGPGVQKDAAVKGQPLTKDKSRKEARQSKATDSKEGVAQRSSPSLRNKSLGQSDRAACFSSVENLALNRHNHRSSSISSQGSALRTPGRLTPYGSPQSPREGSILPHHQRTNNDQAQYSAANPFDEDVSQASQSDAREKPSKNLAASKPPIATTFLPTLAAGGYISGSDSAIGSDEEKAANIQLKKNRRGQQARRAIWEKKYGSNARHVKMQRAGRDHGWDAKRGAIEGKRPTKRNTERATESKGSAPKASFKEFEKASVGFGPAKEKTDVGKLHPSWAAAKRAKESNRTSFTGKKIVFD